MTTSTCRRSCATDPYGRTVALRVRRVTTTRAGGVSRPPFDTFNLGDHVGDDPAAVAANRRRLAAAIGLGGDAVVRGDSAPDARLEALAARDGKPYVPGTIPDGFYLCADSAAPARAANNRAKISSPSLNAVSEVRLSSTRAPAGTP